MFGSGIPGYMAVMLRTAVLEQQKATAIATALLTHRTAAALAGIASSVVAANLGPEGARSAFKHGLFPASDSGRDWGATWSTPVHLTGTYTTGTSSVTATATQVRSLAVDPNNSNIVVASGDRAFYRSVDGGATWAVINLPAPAAFNLSATFTQAI